MTEKATTAPRIAPLAAADWDGDLMTFIAGFRAAVVGEDSDHPGGANLLGTLATHPALTKAFLTFNGHLLYGTTLTDRQRELIVLRVATLRGSEYEWAQHVVLAQNAGMRAEEIARIPDGPDAPGWSPLEQSLLRAADELLADGTVADSTWGVLAAELDEHQLMDVVFTVGTYAMVAMALRSFGVQPDDDLAPYLPGART